MGALTKLHGEVRLMRFVTINRGILYTCVFLIFSNPGFAQLPEDPKVVADSVKANRLPVAPAEDILTGYKAIKWLVWDVRRGNLNAYGPEFETENADAISAIHRFNRAGAGREAIEPYFTKMCRELRAGTSDVISLAQLLNQAEVAEKKALARAYGEIEELLSTSGQTVVASLEKESNADTGSNVQRIDYAGLASDAPGFMHGLLTKACRRYEESAHSNRRGDERPGIAIDPDSEGPFIYRSKPFNQKD